MKSVEGRENVGRDEYPVTTTSEQKVVLVVINNALMIIVVVEEAVTKRDACDTITLSSNK